MKALLPLFALLATTVSAQTYPQPGTGDPRLQTVQYDAGQVIRLTVAPGAQTLVELASGEAIQTIGVGDSVAWQVSPGKRGDFFFVKNVSGSATTNMSVVTANRVYNFELAPEGSFGETSAYHVRLIYPAPERGSANIDIQPSFEYRLSGAKAIRPASVYQEGMRTIVEWPEEEALPGIFMIENGHESLVNGEMQDGRFVIPGTPEKLVFRLDRKTAYATRKPLKMATDE
jgi:type IV secretion system protein VirB9